MRSETWKTRLLMYRQMRKELDKAQEAVPVPTTEPFGTCVWCESDLHESPTNRFWTKKGHNSGLCYNCMCECFQILLHGLEHE